MPDHPLRKLLSGVVRGDDAASVELTYLHRGAPKNMVRIKASEIAHVARGSILLSDRETQIPFHRILYVRDEKKQRVLWTKRNSI